MEKYLPFVILFASVVAQYPSETKHYRTDYVYNEKTDAFYKLHTESRYGWDVKRICEVEGATLMVPSSHHDIVQLHGMFKRFPDLGQYVWVDTDGLNHESAEEQPILDLNPLISTYPDIRRSSAWCDVVSRKGEIETCSCYRQLPFICKVEAKKAPYDEHCGVYGRNYEYIATVGSCYKMPCITYSWNQAYAECRAEGAHLLVLNSEAEMLAVKSFVQGKPKLPDAMNPNYLHIGFREVKTGNKHPRVFKTIFNQTLDEAGYSGWAETEPNDLNGGEECGSIFVADGKLNDIGCSDNYGFICEKEVHLTNTFK